MLKSSLFALSLVVLLAGSASADDKSVCKSGEKGKQAIAACTRLIARGGLEKADLSEIYYERGMKYRYDRNYDKAIPDFTRSISLTPEWAWPYVARGHAYAWTKQFPKAFADQEKAIALDPTYVTYTGRAMDLMEAGALDLALKDLDEALKLKPDYTYGLSTRGDIYRKQGRFDDAIADYKKALESNPDNDAAKDGLKAARNRNRD